MTPQQIEALKLALEALEGFYEYGYDRQECFEHITALEEALAEHAMQEVQRLGQEIEQEPVADALHFAHWTTDKKDLSDYFLVGSLTLAGIEDGEYGTSEIDPLDNTIDALQERLVTGSDHKKVPLLAYIGALKPTPPQPERHELQAKGEHPAPCARHCEANAFQIVIKNLKAQLAQPEQEPCVHAKNSKGCYRVRCQLGDKCVDDEMSFRTAPLQRKPLTNGEIYTAYITATNQTLRATDERLAFAFARAIEAAHGIKENT
jgi:hypothetical protein